MKCPICGREMSMEQHTAGNTDSKWGDRALASLTIAGSLVAGSLLPGPGHAIAILGCKAGSEVWNKSSQNYKKWSCKHCGYEIKE